MRVRGGVLWGASVAAQVGRRKCRRGVGDGDRWEEQGGRGASGEHRLEVASLDLGEHGTPPEFRGPGRIAGTLGLMVCNKTFTCQGKPTFLNFFP